MAETPIVNPQVLHLIEGPVPGPVGMRHEGEWTQYREYFERQAVTHRGSMYLAIKPSASLQPHLYPLHWELLASKGEWEADKVFLLYQLSLPIVAGKLTFDFGGGDQESAANSVFVLVNQHITDIDFVNFPPAGKSIRMQVYLQQDAVGGHVIQPTAWPKVNNVSQLWVAAGVVPAISTNPHSRDQFLLDTFDGGISVHYNQIGFDYKPL